MGLSMLDNGRMTNKKAMGKKNGKMVLIIRVNIEVEKNKEKGLLFGVMIVLMKVILCRTTFMGRANICGKMEEYMKDNGTIIRCMGKEYSLGLMGVAMKENMTVIKNTDLEHLHSEMDAYMKESGRMENSTDVGFTVRRRYQERGYGRMV